jgi:hypothetical protein
MSDVTVTLPPQTTTSATCQGIVLPAPTQTTVEGGR